MRSFVLGSLLASCVFVAMGWASERSKAEALHSSSRGVATVGTPLRIADLTLDRLKRIPFTVATGANITVPMPSTYGLVIDQFYSTAGGGNVSLNVNGADLGAFPVGGNNVTSSGTYVPPLVIRPSDVVTMNFNLNFGASGVGTVLMVAWEVGPGEV